MPTDLVVLAADQCIKNAVEGLVRRISAARGCGLNVVYLIHPRHDPGCCRSAQELLRSYCQLSAHALVVFDHQGCGMEEKKPEDIERRVEQDLAKNGWEGRSCVVVISPELEQWVWQPSRNLADVLGWSQGWQNLHAWLQGNGLWQGNVPKPGDPKKAMQQALRQTGKPYSASLFFQLAQKLDPRGCRDRAFLKLWRTLLDWF